jgi:hypothetical protein
MSSPRVRLGTWRCPSGTNSVDVFFRRESPGLEHFDFEWDDPPPLRPADDVYYRETIMPAVHRCIAELEERPIGRALYIRTGPDS